MIPLLILIFMLMVNPVFAECPGSCLKSTAVPMSNSRGGIGFDDMVYSPELHQVIIPAGQTGKVYLIDSASLAMTSIGGFSSSAVLRRGREVGVSSADEKGGYIFAADHRGQELVAVDLETGSVVAKSKLAADADYVRYVKTDYLMARTFKHTEVKQYEIWVTEPHHKQIEVFTFLNSEHPLLKLELTIPVVKGPESLMIDHTRDRAYTNLGTLAAAIDLDSHNIVWIWPSGCKKSRGDALDEKRGFLFVSCSEGRAVVFDLNHGHKKISDLPTDPGPDVISYNPKLSHLYFSSGKNASLSVIGVSATGKLSLLGKAKADPRAHCVVSDDQNNIWVCDPPRGLLLRYKDTL